MKLIFKLKANELNEDFSKVLKTQFRNKELRITVRPIEDETEYLLKTKANRQSLLKAVSDMKKRKSFKE